MSSPFTNPAGRAPAQASAYVASILGMLGDRDPLQVQERTPRDLAAAVAGLAPSDAERPEAPGKWSVAQVVRHLTDSEVVCGWRLRLVLAQDSPMVTGYDQDAWSARLAAAYPTLDAALSVFTQLRGAHTALLRSLAPQEWERVGRHAERGPESVRHMAKLYAGHDLVHLAQIARIRKGLGR